MDEIDAALDFKNVSIIGHYIRVTKNDFITFFFSLFLVCWVELNNIIFPCNKSVFPS